MNGYLLKNGGRVCDIESIAVAEGSERFRAFAGGSASIISFSGPLEILAGICDDVTSLYAVETVAGDLLVIKPVSVAPEAARGRVQAVRRLLL